MLFFEKSRVLSDALRHLGVLAMSYGIIRVEKHKSGQVGGLQYHNDREPGRHNNPDIDPSRTPLNFEMVPHGEYQDEVRTRIALGRTSTTAVRKDAVVLVEGIVTASPEWFEGHSDADARAYFEDAKRFCEREFGAGNLVHFTVHMDETTPHAHFGFVPLKNGTLSWKNFFDGRAAMSHFQDRFYEQVSGPRGMDRGEKRGPEEPVVRHRSVQDYKADNRRELADLDKELAAKKAEVDEVTKRLERLRREEGELAGEVDRLERLEPDELAGLCEEVARECAGIAAESAKASAGPKSLGGIPDPAELGDRAARRGGVLADLCARCKEAARGLWGRVGELGGRIADMRRAASEAAQEVFRRRVDWARGLASSPDASQSRRRGR